MWSLRRFSHPLRRQRHRCGASRTLTSKLDTERNVVGDGASICNPTQLLFSSHLPLKEFYHRVSMCEQNHMGTRCHCSQSSAIDDENDSFKDGTSEIEAPAMGEHIVEEEDGEELVSEEELSDGDSPYVFANDMEIEDTEMGENGGDSHKKRETPTLFKAVVADRGQSVGSAVEKWVEEGNSLDRAEISLAILNLRKRRMFGKALQFLEWLEANKQLEFTERDYASRVDLIAKVGGIQKAEKYIDKLPESFRGEVVYRTLLANCVNRIYMKKSEQVFNRMRELGVPITIFSCDLMILLYKRLDKKRISDILLLMEKENINRSLFTYKILINTKGEANDIIGMEQLVKNMKADGIEPDLQTLSTLARHYVSGGLKSKAIAIVKDIEEGRLKGNLGAHEELLCLYGSLRNADEVRRIWKFCEPNPKIEECIAAIEAWGKLGAVEEAEAVFENMVKRWERFSSKNYHVILNVYVNNKLVKKGIEFIKRMGDSGNGFGPSTWDAIVRLYVEAGELEKAYSVLENMTKSNRLKPMFNSFMIIMDRYAKNGDTHNAEKVLYKMRQCGYTGRLKPYEVLLQAYVNAKIPAYGFRERMKGDDVFANRSFAAQLARVDAFRRTAISDLLD